MATNRSDPTDGRKRRWEQHNTDRRRHIIDAALTVLARDESAGETLKAQQIAAEADLHRTVIYRHFQDRADLHTAIQRAICDELRSTLTASVVLEGTPRTVVHRIVETYVRWIVDHAAWVRFAEQDVSGATGSPLQEAIGQIGEQIELAVAGFLALVGADLSDDDHKLVSPWVSGLVSGCMGSARAWNAQGDDKVDFEHFTSFIADTIWLQVTGLGASRGIEIPQVPLEELFVDTDR